jgi:hypothetical protein
MDLAALLELLYSASGRWHSVRATVRRWKDEARERDLLRARGLYVELPQFRPRKECGWRVSGRSGRPRSSR